MRALKGAQVQARGAWLPPLGRVTAGGTWGPADGARPSRGRTGGPVPGPRWGAKSCQLR